MTKAKGKIAIINSNEELIEAIQMALGGEGFEIVTGHVPDFKAGEKDILKFFNEEKPDVVIFDIAYPYEENWSYFKLVQNSEKTNGINFVLTTTNLKRVNELMENGQDVIELVDKPFELKKLVQKINNLIGTNK